MRPSSKGIAVVFGVVLGMAASVAQAQDQTPTGQLELASTTSPKQKLDFAREAIAEMQDAVKNTGKLLEVAERDGDADKIQCVRNKLASIQALLEVSERAQGAMKEALASNQPERSEHEFRKIAVARAKTRQFLAEAEACVGGKGVVAGVTDVDVTTEGLAEGDETGAGLLDDFITEPPDDISIYK